MISVTPNTINTGSSANITWSVTNSPTSCTASNAWSGSKASSGSQSTGIINNSGTLSYTLSCSNDGGSSSQTATLIVNQSTAATYCGGLTPCYGPADMALHTSFSSCWSYQTSGTTTVVYNMTNFAPNHSGGSSTILTTSNCGNAINWSGTPSNSKHTAVKSNTQVTLNSYRVGYYDANKP